MQDNIPTYLPSSLVRRVEAHRIRRAINRVIRSFQTPIRHGDRELEAFESALTKRFGVTSCVGLRSGTDALILSLRALGITHGDEVIVPAFGFISTASAVLWAGATPIFADIEPYTYGLTAQAATANISPRTKAIVFAHLFGLPAAQTLELAKLARTKNLALIEDAAQAFDARLLLDGEWRPVGTIGTLAIFSFSSTKPFTVFGSGGALVTANATLAKVVRELRFYGAREHFSDYPALGLNAKLDPANCAALRAALPFASYWEHHREKLAHRYSELLDGIQGLMLPPQEEGSSRTWYRYTIRTTLRDQLFKHLRASFSRMPWLLPKIYYPRLLPEMDVFGHFARASEEFPTAFKVSQEILSLPLDNRLPLRDVERVAASVRQFFQTNPST